MLIFDCDQKRQDRTSFQEALEKLSNETGEIKLFKIINWARGLDRELLRPFLEKFRPSQFLIMHSYGEERWYIFRKKYTPRKGQLSGVSRFAQDIFSIVRSIEAQDVIGATALKDKKAQ